MKRYKVELVRLTELDRRDIIGIQAFGLSRSAQKFRGDYIEHMFRDQSKKMIKKQEYFSLRKFKRGLASVTVGATLFMAGAALETLVVPQAAVVYADVADYAINSTWELSDKITSGLQTPRDADLAFSSATATVVKKDGSNVAVHVAITPTNTDQTGSVYVMQGNNQGVYSATANMFAGETAPATMPALAVMVQTPMSKAPERSQELIDKLNFNGKVDQGFLTITFSEAVTNPIIDISGLGGLGQANSTTYARGSFNSTDLELLTEGVSLEAASSGANLAITPTKIAVVDRNTYNHSVVTENQHTGSGNTQSPRLAPAGAGSIRVIGTTKEVKFKLAHVSTPFSSFSKDAYNTGDAYFVNNNNYLADGINGYNKFWNETYETAGRTANNDQFRLSVRLSNTKYGSVVVNYVDTEGNVIGTEFKDTTKQEVGTAYDTTPNTGTVASDATTERPAVITKDGKTYKLVAKDTTATVGTVKADGSLATNGANFNYGTDAVSGVVAEGTKSITYVYEEVKGSVIVDYVDTDGNKIGTQFVDTANVAPGTTYNTANDTGTKASTETSERPSVITKDGKTYKLVPAGDYNVGTVGKDGNLTTTTKDLGTDAASGEVAEGTKKVTYVYQEVKTGSVVIDYVDTEGNELQKQYVDSPEGTAVGTTYDAEGITGTTEKPAVIEKDGKTYELVPAGTYTVGTVGEDNNLTATTTTLGVAPVTGTVVEGVTKITYVYKEKVEAPKTGNVVITYVDTEGLELKATVKDTTDGEVGSTYNTKDSADEYPETIEKDGVTYKRVVAGTHKVGETTEDGHLVSSDAAEGTVEEGTKTVTYVYEKVETPVVKTGSVVARYVIEGTEDEIADDKSVKPTDTPVDEPYGDTPPATITKDGKTYELVRTRTNEGDAPENGVVKEGEQTITYEYKEKVETPVVKTGSVVARYVIEGTEDEIADDKSVKPTDTPVDEPYGDTPPATIEKGGKTYELVRTRTNEGDAPSNGTVVEGEQTITYEYKEKVETPVVKTGSVVARYVIEGTEDEIADDKSVKPTDTPVDEPYGDTPPTTISFGGKTYTLVRTRTNEGDAPSNGTVVEGEQTITYEYKEVVDTPDPVEKKTGSVLVRHITDKGEVLADTTDVVRDGEVGSTYETSVGNFEGYTFVKVDEKGATPTGEVEEGEKTVVYIYTKVETPVAKTGSVLVRHITDKGEVLADTTDVVRDGEVGSTYETSVGNFEGYTFVKVDEKGATPTGEVEEGEKTVVYIYTKVETPVVKTGSVVARYVIEGTEDEIADDKSVKPTDTPVDEPYGDTPPATITKDGKTYELVRTRTNEGDAPSNGTVVEGEQTITYEYKEKVETPVVPPVVEKQGKVIVHYVDEKGNVIKTPVVDTENGTVGGDYDTSDNRPKVIVFNGKRYILVESRIPNNAKGKVVEGETHVTYVYKQENEEPTTPTTPNQPTTPSTTPVTETAKVTPKTSAILPETGESTSALALVGLALLGTVAVASRRRKAK
ncbi:MucBP domain-containing protein [Streptococcus suis]|uniref:MucBP domain-containing protein n=2 Tax=Streptococcus suis TaxID=1307 RepID=UPI000CF5BF94|nr:MucBP domain-containing protein [Streptococcus suis]